MLPKSQRFSTPFNSLTPKYGTAIAEIRSMKAKSITSGDCLPSLRMTLSTRDMPATVPMMQNTEAKRPYETLSMSFMMYVNVDAPVAKIIMYMPVDEATLGGTPTESRSGLNIAPPPSPSAPATHPPMIEKVSNLARVFPSKIGSPGTRPDP